MSDTDANVKLFDRVIVQDGDEIQKGLVTRVATKLTPYGTDIVYILLDGDHEATAFSPKWVSKDE